MTDNTHIYEALMNLPLGESIVLDRTCSQAQHICLRLNRKTCYFYRYRALTNGVKVTRYE